MGCSVLTRLPSVSVNETYCPTSGISIGSPSTLPPASVTFLTACWISSTAITMDGYGAGQSGFIGKKPPLIAPGFVGPVWSVSAVVAGRRGPYLRRASAYPTQMPTRRSLPGAPECPTASRSARRDSWSLPPYPLQCDSPTMPVIACSVHAPFAHLPHELLDGILARACLQLQGRLLRTSAGDHRDMATPCKVTQVS